MIHQLRERPVLLREALGEELRELRLREGRTLRDVSAKALVSLGYLSEVERGRKEASSEMLASICEAHDVTLPQLLGSVAKRLEGTTRPLRPAPLQARAA
jgi:transcriptional regulator with XRE-family HTH domain